MGRKHKFLLGIVSVLTLLNGCAGVPAKKENVNIEVEASPQIRIFNVAVYSAESHVIVTGKLHKRSHSRTIIPGHIDITFLSLDGEILQTVETKYRRSSLKSRDSTFKVEIPIDLAKISTVHVEHFRKSVH